MANPIPALTVWQPWASLIAEGCKPFEFRGWQAPRRLWGKRIAIHAGARPIRHGELVDLVNRLSTGERLGTIMRIGPAMDLLEIAARGPRSLPLSAVIALATVGEPLPPEEVGRRFANDSDRDAAFCWAWPMLDVVPLQPVVPARGSQGFWAWMRPDEPPT